MGGDQRLKTLIIHFGLGQSGCSSGSCDRSTTEEEQGPSGRRRGSARRPPAFPRSTCPSAPVPSPGTSRRSESRRQNSCRIWSSENGGEELLPERRASLTRLHTGSRNRDHPGRRRRGRPRRRILGEALRRWERLDHLDLKVSAQVTQIRFLDN